MATNSINTLRLMGMSSGLDTQGIIDGLAKVEQMKIDAQLRKQTTMQWKQESFTSIKNDLNSFRSNFLSTTGINSMLKTATYKSFKVTLSGAKSSAVSISASSSATAKNLSISSIRLAESAKASGTLSSNIVGGSISGSTKLSDIKGLTFTEDTPATYKTVDVYNKVDTDATEITADNVGGYYIAETNDEGETVYRRATVDDLASEDVTFLEHSTEQVVDQEEKAGTISFSINDKTFTFDKNTTLSAMMSEVNSANLGVTMSYSSLSGKLSITSAGTGTAQKFSIEDGGGNAFGVNGAFGIKTGEHEGKDAEVTGTVDGDDFTYTNASNNFTVDGLTFTLNNALNEGDDEINAVVSRDVDTAVNNIKKFVDSYNTLISKLEGLLKEKKTKTESSYTPLTEEEKADMTEADIEKWEKIAKKGLHYNDSELKSLVNDLRSMMYDEISAAGISPSSIGFSTGSYFGGTGGQIVLDEDKLRAALEKDPDKVQNMFMNITDNKGTGWLYKIDKRIKSYIDNGADTSIKNLKNSLTTISDKISTMQSKMETYLDNLYKKYSKLETAMSELNSQSSWFSSMAGSLK